MAEPHGPRELTALGTLPLRCLECPALHRVLLVQHAAAVPAELADTLRTLGLHAQVCGPAALDRVEERDYEFALWDAAAAAAAETEAMHRLRQQCPRLPLLVLANEVEAETAIELVKAGAHDILARPPAPAELYRAIQRALQTRRLLCAAALLPSAPAGRAAASRFVGRSPALQEVFKQIGLVARRDEPVLILGETGTGKELVAQTIHRHSRRAEQPLVAVNCAALPEGLLESELFGHEKGAFTGAVQQRLGAFERADGGTLFLDEIGDMSLPLQAKILRALQQGEIQRVGGRAPITVNVRLLTATNRVLEEAIRQGTFREDLYYRLNVVAIHLPPLREHREDIRALVEHFIERYTPPGEPRPALDAQALAKLHQHRWPGNVRELENTIRRALVTANGDAVMEKDIVLADVPQGPPGDGNADLQRRLDEELDAALLRWLEHLARQRAGADTPSVPARMEAKLLHAALELTHGNQVQAARLLGISRTTLRQWLTRIRPAPEQNRDRG